MITETPGATVRSRRSVSTPSRPGMRTSSRTRSGRVSGKPRSASAPALVLPRPGLAWSALIPVGLTLFAGQFLFQFFGIAYGMPPGLASVVVQTQALFTIVLAALALGERPAAAQWIGSVVALAGLGL